MGSRMGNIAKTAKSTKTAKTGKNAKTGKTAKGTIGAMGAKTGKTAKTPKKSKAATESAATRRSGAGSAGSTVVPKRGSAKAVPAEPPPFEGFPKDFLAFFREITRNNDREWFAANKERFRASVQTPALSFIAAMDLPLGRIADCFVADARTQGGSMFRIYNDMRFHNAKPYKEHAACQFRHMAGKDAHAPGFYVHLDPKEVFFGGGIWRPPAPQLRAIREAIAADPERWQEATGGTAFRRRFGTIRGDSLKRPPQGFDADHPAIEDIKRLSFFAMQSAPPESILSKRFVADVSKSFAAMAPFMQFLTEALDLPFHLDD